MLVYQGVFLMNEAFATIFQDDELHLQAPRRIQVANKDL